MDRPLGGLVVAPALDEVEGGVGQVQQRLPLERLEADDLEAFGASDADFGLEEVQVVGFCGYVEFLKVTVSLMVCWGR